MKNKFCVSILLNSSVIFTLLTVLINSFFAVLYIDEDINPLLNIGQNLLLLLISAIISLILALLLNKFKKNIIFEKIKLIYFSCSLYLVIFILTNLVTIVYKNIWNIFTILIIFVTSILASIANTLLPIKKSYIKAIINFFLFAIPYFIICLSFGNYGQNNRIIILMSVYLLSYTIITTAYFVTKSQINKHKNEKKEYYRLFK